MCEGYEYDWSSLPGSTSAPVSTMTMEQYLALPEDVSRRDDGPVMSIEHLRLTADGIYVSEELSLRTESQHTVETNDPFPITITWDALDNDL